MHFKHLIAVLAFGLPFTTSCTDTAPAEHATRSQGSVAASRDDALVYAADSDTDTLYVFSTASETLLASVKTGPAPAQVVVGLDDTIYVTNRAGRSVSVIRRGEWKEAMRLEVGVEPTALAVTGDGKTLYVVSSTSRESPDFGTLSAFETASLSKKWEIAVGPEPRGLALLNGDKAMVSLFKDGDVVLVDLKDAKVVKSGTDVNDQLNRLPVQGSKELLGGPMAVNPVGARVRGAGALAASPDGQWVFAAASLASSQIISVEGAQMPLEDGGFLEVDGGFDGFPGREGGGGSGYGGGSCGSTAIASPALLSFTPEAVPTVDDLFNCESSTVDLPSTVMQSASQAEPLQAPRAAVVDASGAFVFVAHHDSNNVAVVPTSKRNFQSHGFDGKRFGPSVQRVVSVGAGPTGLVLMKNGTQVWVYGALDHSLTKIESENGLIVGATKTVKLGGDVLPADAVAGRKHFFSATDAKMTSVGLSCGSCHFDGREDGHVWNFTTGPRQTPMLAGRKLEQTAPLHWDGEFQGMADLSHSITRRMGGDGITLKMSQDISAYLATLPVPENPARRAEPTAGQLRGAQVFTKANCQSCHAGEALTNNGFADVGTLARGNQIANDDVTRLPQGFNTPSLIGLARTAPYLHDGSAATLKERIQRGKADDRHGLTSKLSEGEVDDLVAYLQSL